jgi:branched-chain amino acid aminotransferase
MRVKPEVDDVNFSGAHLIVSIDGVVRAPSEAHVSVFDRGFLYGDSVFETIRTYSGRPFALNEHLDRLWRSAELVFIEMPCSREQLIAEIDAALRATGNPESYIRVMVTRGQGEMGLDPSLAEVPVRVIIVGPLKTLPADAYESGAYAVTFQTARPSDATSPGAKIGNYLVAVLAMREAKKHGANEALIVDREGLVAEGASSNVFLVRDGRLVTPPLNAGILAGVTRRYALRAAKDLGIDVEEACPAKQELLAADEVFVSSSIRELLPIVRVDGRTIGPGIVGPVTRAIRTKFQQLVEQDTKAVH